MLLLFTIIPPPLPYTIQPCEKPLDPRNNHEKKFRPTKFPGEKSHEIQRQDGTDPPDPRNLVHFVKND